MDLLREQKEYEYPEIEIVLFSDFDVVASSSAIEDEEEIVASSSGPESTPKQVF